MIDPHANFRAEVACYTSADPYPTIDNLSKLTGIPADQLIRYVLVKYAASASDALLAMDPIVFRQMREHIARAEQEGTENARLTAYEALKQIVSWLGLPSQDPPTSPAQPHPEPSPSSRE
jgi:hypothetical protein